MKNSELILKEAELRKTSFADQFSDPQISELAGRIAVLESQMEEVLKHLDK